MSSWGIMQLGHWRVGWSIRGISVESHLDISTVHQLWRQWLEGNVPCLRDTGGARAASASKLWQPRHPLPSTSCNMWRTSYMLSWQVGPLFSVVASGLPWCPLRKLIDPTALMHPFAMVSCESHVNNRMTQSHVFWWVTLLFQQSNDSRRVWFWSNCRMSHHVTT